MTRSLTIVFFSLGISLLVLSLFIRIVRINAGYYGVSSTGERGYIEQKRAAELLEPLVPSDQLVAVAPEYHNIYWKIWGNMNARRMENQNIAEIQSCEQSGLLWGFVVVDPSEFISGFDEETQKDLIIPLLDNPSQFPQYEVLRLSPVISAYHYIGKTDPPSEYLDKH